MTNIAQPTKQVTRQERGILLTLLSVSKTKSAFLKGGTPTARVAAELAADGIASIRTARQAGVQGCIVTLIGGKR